MTTTPRHPLDKRLPDRRRPDPELQQALEQIAPAAHDVAGALTRFAEQVGLALTEWQQRVLRRLYPDSPDPRDDYALTR